MKNKKKNKKVDAKTKTLVKAIESFLYNAVDTNEMELHHSKWFDSLNKALALCGGKY
jgi:hypothetical protein